ncbi:hypothetical protein [Arcobacter vandammei]|uniref:hypothetical protein n=1 Tax=Arcobacter vandammei TaxID=2782243 RepID=UPI0018E01423|nr:hypothetical protein [Arcobacter vandammei]
MKKELKIFIFILLILTILMHYKEFLSHPIEQITLLTSSGAYGFGAFHPVVFSAIIYLIIGIPRLIYKLIKGR